MASLYLIYILIYITEPFKRSNNKSYDFGLVEVQFDKIKTKPSTSELCQVSRG